MFYSVQALIHYVKFVMFLALNAYTLVVKIIRGKFIYFPLLIYIESVGLKFGVMSPTRFVLIPLHILIKFIYHNLQNIIKTETTYIFKKWPMNINRSLHAIRSIVITQKHLPIRIHQSKLTLERKTSP